MPTKLRILYAKILLDSKKRILINFNLRYNYDESKVIVDILLPLNTSTFQPCSDRTSSILAIKNNIVAISLLII